MSCSFLPCTFLSLWLYLTRHDEPECLAHTWVFDITRSYIAQRIRAVRVRRLWFEGSAK